MGSLCGETCIMLTSTCFDWSTRVTDRQTEGRLHSTLCILSASLAKNRAIPFNRDILLLLFWPPFRLYTVFRKKNTHSHFLSYLHEWCVDLNKNCSEYTQGIVDSEYVYIRYSLWPMTSLWRHFCLAKVEASLQHAISRISFFASTGHLLVRRRGRIVYYLVEFKTI